MTSPRRCVIGLISVFFISLLVACSNSSTPSISVSLTPGATQSIDQAQTVSITATIANDSKSAGVTWSVAGGGTLSNQMASGATYNAPASVTTSFPATVTATSVSDPSKSASLRINVNPLPTITTQSVPQATAGVTYSAVISTSGGSTPFTWSISSGTLPAGITLGTSTGSSVPIFGMATGPGRSSVTVKVVDASGNSATQALTITVNPAATLAITTTSLATGVLGAAYSQTLTATGGVPGYQWTIVSGSLPPGLTLNASSGTISGTPTATGISGFSVKVTDSGTPSPQTAEASLSITINTPPPLQITTTSLPNGTTGSSYAATLAATGGVQPYSWSVTSGSLPAGLTLTSNSGQISGTPTATGAFAFTVQVKDSENPAVAVTANLSITIAAGTPLQINTSTLPEGSEATSYAVTLAASGGTQPYTWSLASGSLPGGLTLNASAGTITGKPTATGTFNITLKVTDSASGTASAPLSIFVIACNNDSALNGNWAMMLRGYNNNQQPAPFSAAVGSFVADGSGNITGGSIDINDQVNGPASGSITSGKYCIATNNTGLMTLNQNVGGSSTAHTYAIALNSSNSNGHLISYDNSALVTSGPLRQQTTSAFATSQISGYYAFGLIGADSGGAAAISRSGMAGTFLANGAGTLNGIADSDADGTLGSEVTVQAGDLTVLSSTTGRGTVTIAIGSTNMNFVFYVVSSTELLLMESDAVTKPLLAGQVLGQTEGGSFSNISLDGIAILGAQAIDGSGAQPAGFVTAGTINAGGNGTASINLDQNDAGTEGTVSATGTYAVSPSGRVTLTGFGNHPPVLYLISPNTGFAIGTDDTVLFGRFFAQSGSSFTNGSITGSYSGGSEPPEDVNSGSEVDLLTSDGVGDLTGFSLASNGSAPQNTPISATYSVSGNGRVTVSQGGNQVGIVYIIDSSALLFMPVGGPSGTADPTVQWLEQ
ncbi:MAG: putative Ig domain-containing protein [Terriglobales bacterium]